MCEKSLHFQRFGYIIVSHCVCRGAGWESVRDPKLIRFSISNQILLSASSEIPVDKAETVPRENPVGRRKGKDE
jgi:hypothetical protein